MGLNATVVVCVDALENIKNDASFGRNLAAAISGVEMHGEAGQKDVAAGNHANAAMVVEVHHADSTALVTVGGNLGLCHVTSRGWDHHAKSGQEKLLREWAANLGFDLVPSKK